jgi:hypothetical protein
MNIDFQYVYFAGVMLLLMLIYYMFGWIGFPEVSPMTRSTTHKKHCYNICINEAK